jgi:hypothetical protein
MLTMPILGVHACIPLRRAAPVPANSPRAFEGGVASYAASAENPAHTPSLRAALFESGILTRFIALEQRRLL